MRRKLTIETPKRSLTVDQWGWGASFFVWDGERNESVTFTVGPEDARAVARVLDAITEYGS